MPLAGLHWKSLVARSPLTDPRAMGTSLVCHLLLVGLASMVALSAVVPVVPEQPRALSGELDSVDNRAPD